MAKEPGYIYIFTNESFKDDWVKIGKTKDVEKRLKDLDNTSCPLPFKIYATMKTCKYHEGEDLVHEFIAHFNKDLRVRPNREYFKVSPEDALDILFKVQKVIDDAEIEIYNSKAKKLFKDKIKAKPKEEEEDPIEKMMPFTMPKLKEYNKWCICYDKDYFKVEECLKKYGQIYWTHKPALKGVKKGDVAYLYSSAPESAIRFKVEVIADHLPYSPEMDVQDEFDKKVNKEEDMEKECFLVRIIAATKAKKLTYKNLLSQKLIGKRVSHAMISQERFKPLLSYIEEHFFDTDGWDEEKPKVKKQKPQQKEKKPRKKPRPPFKFSMIDLKPGDVVHFVPANLDVIVASDNEISYNSEVYSFNAFCLKYLPAEITSKHKKLTFQGPDYFTYKGMKITKIRDEREKR